MVDAAFQRRYSLECGVLPVPFIGDPRSAAVVLLQLNPGYDELDPDDEAEIDGYAKALRAATVFRGDGFFPLDRRFKRRDLVPKRPLKRPSHAGFVTSMKRTQGYIQNANHNLGIGGP